MPVTADRVPLAERLREQRSLLTAIGIAELIAIVLVSTINTHDHIDGEVYRLGAQALVQGKDLYHNLPTTESGLNLPFIYPPFAAMVFAPMALVPKSVSIAVVMVVSHLALLISLYVVMRESMFLRAHRDKVMLVAVALLPLATITEPIMETITYGQINLVLMVLVFLDCLWRVNGTKKLPYPRGLLIGLAAGIKLTPLVFLLLPLLRRDFRTIITALLTFLGTALLGFLVTFDNARQFWFHEMFASSHVQFGPQFTGDASVYAGNQSLKSMLTKLHTPHLTVVFGVLAVLLVVLAVLGMLHSIKRRDLPMAVTINGVLGLLLSPISWSHHWVWAIPGLILLIGAAYVRRDWGMIVILAVISGCFTFGPHWKVPQGNGLEMQWSVFEMIVGNTYVICGIVFIVAYAYFWYKHHNEAPETADPRGEEPEGPVAPLAAN